MLGKVHAFGTRSMHQMQPHEKQQQDTEKVKKEVVGYNNTLQCLQLIGYDWKFTTSEIANQTYWLHFIGDKDKAHVTHLVQGRVRLEPEPEIIPFIIVSATQSSQGGEHLHWQ